MTKEEKIAAYAMRLGGSSLQEVADKFGVSREYIRQITPPTGTLAQTRSSYEKCIYPNISSWLYENRYSYNRFSKLICCTCTSIYNALIGKTDPSKCLIDKILDATGMTYEVAFEQKNGEVNSNGASVDDGIQGGE